MTLQYVTFVVLWLCSFSEYSVKCDTLQIAHVLYRHGARSPTRFFPTNPNQVDAWPDGTGRLTQKGMMLEYNLGRFLQERYVTSKFINHLYLHKEVYIRSSSIDRCLQSAQAQLAGLYPPSGWQVWNKNINWQPIPVQTLPGSEDILLRPTESCPRVGEIWSEMVQSDEIKEVTKENKELLDYMTENSGENITLSNMWDVTDDILCEQSEGLKSAVWVNQRFPEILNLSNYAFNYLYQGTDELGRLLGGALLGTINKNMVAAMEGDKNIHKLNIFSGHDTSILAFTTALNIKFPIPSFSACILVELYKNEQNELYVTINYRNGLGDQTTITQMNLPGCQYKCSLENFLRITLARIPVDRAKECQLKKPLNEKSISKLQILVAVLLSTTIFLFFVFLWLIMRIKCRKKWIGRKRKQKEGMTPKFTNSKHEKDINDEDEEDESAALVL